MGNFEKLVVLTVLFLSAIVLAVSLSGSDEKENASPLAAAERSLAGDDVARGGTPGADRLTLSAEGRPEAEAEAEPDVRPIQPLERPDAAGPEAQTPGAGAAIPPARNEAGHPRVLRTLDGLSATALPDYKLYTAADGDTWSALAIRFYQSGTFVPLLRAANEELERPTAGAAIYVPVYDFRVAPQDRTPREARPVREARELAQAPAQPAAPAAGAKSYVVVEGDSLWRIASKVYSSGARWEEIYKANQDVLPNPDALAPGMTLRIP